MQSNHPCLKCDHNDMWLDGDSCMLACTRAEEGGGWRVDVQDMHGS